jgi:hypothetical protein
MLLWPRTLILTVILALGKIPSHIFSGLAYLYLAEGDNIHCGSTVAKFVKCHRGNQGAPVPDLCDHLWAQNGVMVIGDAGVLYLCSCDVLSSRDIYKHTVRDIILLTPS